MSEKKFRLKYSLETKHGLYSQEDIKEDDGAGGTDALIVMATVFKQGSPTFGIQTVDGRNDGKRLHDKELYKAWSWIAGKLSKSPELEPGRKKFAQFTNDLLVGLATGNKKASKAVIEAAKILYGRGGKR